MVVFAFYAYWWGRLYLAMSGVESSMKSGKANENATLLSILSQEFLIQLGIFIVLPMLLENTVEKGFLFSLWEFILAHLRLAPVFYTFSLGTRAHYFGRTLVHGRAKFYARSHFTKAVELGLLITVYSFYSQVLTGTFVYLASWSLVVSWILSPFIFNPLGFDWLKTVNDFHEFKNWIWQRSGVFVKAEESWEKWWYEEHDHLRTTSLWGEIVEIIWNLRFLVFQYGIVYQLDIANGSKSLAVYLFSCVYVVMAAVIYVTLAYLLSKYDAREHVRYRLVQFLFIFFAVVVIIVLSQFTELSYLDLLVSPLAFLPTGWGLISIALVLEPLLENTGFWVHVVSAARLYEFIIGLIVIAPVAILSWLPGVQAMQNRILFNAVFSRGIHSAMLLKWKRKRV
ncbi:callose synthase 11-like [Henckelia pumila]|uniref:callose synthase 11-like n=1 Tax=Henckelia pumila TaxID=405737 RepID=UPI003C6DE24E